MLGNTIKRISISLSAVLVVLSLAPHKYSNVVYLDGGHIAYASDSVTSSTYGELKKLSATSSLAFSSTPIQIDLVAEYDSVQLHVAPQARWSSSNANIATVSDTGVVTFTGQNGTVSITGAYGSKTVTLTTTVYIQSIVIQGDLRYNDSPVQLTVLVQYGNSQSLTMRDNVSWSSDNTSVASVDSSGRITFTGADGTANIVASYGGLRTLKTVTVNRSSPTYVSIEGNLSYSTSPTQLSLRSYYTDGSYSYIYSGVQWTSNNNNIATVDSNGMVTFVSNSGSVTITASYLGKTDSISTSANYTDIDSIRIDGDTTYSPSPVQLKVIGIRKNGTTTELGNVVWTSTNPSIVSINSYGEITFSDQEGTSFITATYNSLIATRAVTVTLPTLQSMYFKNTVNYGSSTSRFDVEAYYMDPYYTALISNSKIQWSSSNTDVATVNSDGVVSFTGRSGTSDITATYRSKSIKTTVTGNTNGTPASTTTTPSTTPTTITPPSNTNNNGATTTEKPIVVFNTSVFPIDKIRTNISSIINNPDRKPIPSFKDTGMHWAFRDILTAQQLGIANGYADNVFRPSDDITRAEFVSLLSSIMHIDTNAASTSMADIQDHWVYGMVAALNGMNIIGGYPDNTFRPDEPITRAEVVTILNKMIDYSQSKVYNNTAFNDISSHWANTDIVRMANLGVVNGKQNGVFAPDDPTSRAEAISILLRVMRLDDNLARLLAKL